MWALKYLPTVGWVAATTEFPSVVYENRSNVVDACAVVLPP